MDRLVACNKRIASSRLPEMAIKMFCLERHQQGRMLADQEMKVVGDFLGTFSGTTGIQGTEGTNSESVKPLSFQ